MTTRTTAPIGAPCWADLWTSDVEASRSFYTRLFGWEAQEPDPAFGGYFMFTRQGAPVAGAMGSMGDLQANDTWKPYLCTDDIEACLKKATAAGARIDLPASPVADLGIQAVLADPTGAAVGLWQPIHFQGFTVLGEDGAPSWFELHTADHATAVAFYRDVLGVVLSPVADADDFRYWTFRSPGSDEDLGGVADSRAWLAPGAAAWSIYWEVDDLDAAMSRVTELGGSVPRGPDDTPWGRLAEAADPCGASFKLRTSPAAT